MSLILRDGLAWRIYEDGSQTTATPTECAGEIERLHTALALYGLHTWDCAFNDSRGEQPCDCGWEAIQPNHEQGSEK